MLALKPCVFVFFLGLNSSHQTPFRDPAPGPPCTRYEKVMLTDGGIVKLQHLSIESSSHGHLHKQACRHAKMAIMAHAHFQLHPSGVALEIL